MALSTKVLNTGSVTAQTLGTEFSPQLVRDSVGHIQIATNVNPTSFEIRVYGRADPASTTSLAMVYKLLSTDSSPGVNSTDWVQANGTIGLANTATLISPAIALWPYMRVDLHAVTGTGDFDIWLLE